MVLLFYKTKEWFHVEIQVPWYGLKHESFTVSVDFILENRTYWKRRRECSLYSSALWTDDSFLKLGILSTYLTTLKIVTL